MMPLSGMMAPLASLRSSLVYLLRDEFTTAQAPVTTPRTCEPGPGTITISNPASQSISGDNLVLDAVVSGLVLTSSYTKRGGLALFSRWKYTGNTITTSGFGDVDSRGVVQSSYSTRGVRDDSIAPNLPGGGFGAGSYYNTWSVIRNGGGAYAVIENKLAWVGRNVQGSPVTARVAVVGGNTGSTMQIERIFIADIAGGWETRYGIATNYVASPAVGETTTSDADAFVEMLWVAVSGQVWEMSVRRTDDDNRWIIRCDQAGSTMKLIERNAGVETERSNAGQTWTNGTTYRLWIAMVGNSIYTGTGQGARNIYNSATFNNSATGVKTDRAGTDLVTWPYHLSGTALVELQKWTS